MGKQKIELRAEPTLHDALRKERIDFLKNLANELTSLDVLTIKQRGKIHLGDYQMRGWKGKLPFYAFNCEKHGFVVNYSTGYMNMLLCPFCIEEE